MMICCCFSHKTTDFYEFIHQRTEGDKELAEAEAEAESNFFF